MQLGNITGFIDGMMQVVHDSGELSGAATTYDISNLTGDTAEDYILIARVVNGSAGAVDYNIRFSADAGANYGYQIARGVSATASATISTGVNQILLGDGTATGDLSFIQCSISAKSGFERIVDALSIFTASGSTVSQIRCTGGVWSDTATEVTAINLVADAANGFGIGTRFILLKKVVHSSAMQYGSITPNKINGAWESVFSSTIAGAAVTSVDITGLDGDTDQLYMLNYNIIGGAVVGVNPLNLTFNNDGGANYGEQTLHGSNVSTLAAGLTAQVKIDIASAPIAVSDIFAGSILIYAKSGYERLCLINFIDDVTNVPFIGSIITEGGIWSDTASNITSAKITSIAASGIGIGSTFELYKLNL